MDYKSFIERKSQFADGNGFDPGELPGFLFDFQAYLVDWNLRHGRSATFADCGLGKAQRIDQRILTSSGWEEIGNAKVGMQVYGSDGRLHDILGVYPQGIRHMASVTFSDRSKVVCDWDHLWSIKSQQQIYHGRSGRTLTTAAILAEGLEYNGGQKKHFVPLVEPIHFDWQADHVIDSYTMGVVLGDGSLTTGTHSVANPDFSFTQSELPLPVGCTWSDVTSVGRCRTFSIVGGEYSNSENPFTTEIKRLDLHGKRSEFKFIPSEYLYGSIDDRIAILQGLLDTDGYTNGTNIEFSSSSKRLAEEVVFIVRSLGGTATEPSCESAHYTKDGERHECLDKHRTVIKLPSHIPPFMIANKADRHSPIQRPNPLKSIVAIDECGVGEAICIRVDSEDSLYVTEGMTLTHNTPMQLVWADKVVEHTNKPVLIATPLAVVSQTKREAEKFGIEAVISQDGQHPSGARIVLTNYERLHYFDQTKFSGMVCDESSILKSLGGATRKKITRFSSKMPYRLLATATAAPNDYVELGTSSEALGELSHSEMLTRFFRQLDDKGQKKERMDQATAEVLMDADPNYFKKLAFRVSQTIGQWRLKHHAEKQFWRWVASWSRACRMPSDLGYDDGDFILPPLSEIDHIIEPRRAAPGMLFNAPAVGLNEERAERRRTMAERCGFVADLVDHDRPAVVWCHMNQEADTLEDMITDAKQIAGRTPDNKKLELYEAFASGELRVLIIKPKIGAWGLNWQHCNHVVTFASHSYEQHYQSVRRCFRFGQQQPVTVDVVATEGEIRVLGNMRRKAAKADSMFSSIVAETNNADRVERVDLYTNKMESPQWLSTSN